MKLFYKTNTSSSDPCRLSLSVWEEDEWNREGRRWIVRLPEDESRFSDRETKLLCWEFVDWIAEDMYNIRNTWAKRQEWTMEQVEEFLHDLEYDRWMYR